MKPINDYRGRRVTLMGLGRFGGGVGAARFLAECGARVTLTDLRTEAALADSLAELDGLPIERLRLGLHHESDFRDADLVVVNPAVRPGSEYVSIARSSGVPTTTEVALFVRHFAGRVVGVTGTNGKSTTSTLIHGMIAADGRPCRLGGNIGGSLLDDVDSLDDDSWAVLELSSFQLAHLDRERYSPHVAVVTNFAPNHLDWHRTLDDYRRDKQTILRWQSTDGTAVLNFDDPDVAHWPTRGRLLGFGHDRTTSRADGAFVREDGSLCVFTDNDAAELSAVRKGDMAPHIRLNVLAAAAAATSIGVGTRAVEQGVESFQPLPHRLQFVREVAGRRFIDDSNATTPQSVRAALESFDGDVVLLAGGYDKGVELSALASAIREHAKAVALMGQTGPQLARWLRDPAGGRSVPLKVGRSFEHAWKWAVSQSAPGDVVLLSPGCASFDWFRDYEDRGLRFQSAVHAHARLLERADSAAIGSSLRTA